MIKVISVGNGGMNVVNHMIESGVTGAEFISCSRFEFLLQMFKADKKIILGKKLYGLDGGSPARSEKSAIESSEEIFSALRGAKAVIIVAGLGGCDGTGASHVVANFAKELGALTAAVVSLPYKFEGVRRTARAEVALEKLSASVDKVIKFPADEILEAADPKTPITHAFKILDEAMSRAVQNLIATFKAEKF